MGAELTIVDSLHFDAITVNVDDLRLRDFEGPGGFRDGRCSGFVIIHLPITVVDKQRAMSLQHCVVLVRYRRIVSFLRRSCSIRPKTQSAGKKLCPRTGKGVFVDDVGVGCPSQSGQHSQHVQVFILPVTGVTKKAQVSSI